MEVFPVERMFVTQPHQRSSNPPGEENPIQRVPEDRVEGLLEIQLEDGSRLGSFEAAAE